MSLQEGDPNALLGPGIGIGKYEIGGPLGYQVNYFAGFPFLHISWTQVFS